MSDSNRTLALAAGAGFVSGLRSLTLPAFLSHHLASKPGNGTVTPHLAGPRTSTLLSVLAAGEMIADKTPFVPDRTDALSLAGRATFAGLCGVVIAEHRNTSPLPAALGGSLTAVGSTFLSYTLRKHAGTLTSLPDPLLGMVEDALVLLSASRLAAALED